MDEEKGAMQGMTAERQRSALELRSMIRNRRLVEVSHEDAEERELLPMVETMMWYRGRGGALMLGLGALQLVMHWMLDDHGTALATQTPIGADSVGRVHQTPSSRIVTRMYPQLNMAIGSIIAGTMMAASMQVQFLRNEYFRQCLECVSYFVHLQACFQSMIIVVTIMPLAGVVNVYELAFASVLTVAQFLIMLFSDISNQYAFKQWHIIDTNCVRGEAPLATLARCEPHIRSLVGFFRTPMVGATLVHVFTWTIILVHLVEAMLARRVESDFVGLVLFTALMQLVLLFLKWVQIMRPARLVGVNLCTYKFVVAAVDAIEFANMLVVGVVLVYAYATPPAH